MKRKLLIENPKNVGCRKEIVMDPILLIFYEFGLVLLKFYCFNCRYVNVCVFCLCILGYDFIH
jgi:hypothetical protein